MARQRIVRSHFVRATTQAELFTPEAAVEAGYLDRAVEPDALLETALAETTRLAALPAAAFASTKKRGHAAATAHIRETLEVDMRSIAGDA